LPAVTGAGIMDGEIMRPRLAIEATTMPITAYSKSLVNFFETFVRIFNPSLLRPVSPGIRGSSTEKPTDKRVVNNPGMGSGQTPAKGRQVVPRPRGRRHFGAHALAFSHPVRRYDLVSCCMSACKPPCSTRPSDLPPDPFAPMGLAFQPARYLRINGDYFYV
jgi:hypothetical protein